MPNMHFTKAFTLFQILPVIVVVVGFVVLILAFVVSGDGGNDIAVVGIGDGGGHSLKMPHPRFTFRVRPHNFASQLQPRGTTCLLADGVPAKRAATFRGSGTASQATQPNEANLWDFEQHQCILF